MRRLRHRSRCESGSNDSGTTTHAADLSAHRQGRMEPGRPFDHLRRGGGSDEQSPLARRGRTAPRRRSDSKRQASPACPRPPASGDRVAFTQWRFDIDIYRFEPDGPGQALLTSTFLDMNPRFSPDGLRIAFSSGRTAETPEIWVAAADGRGAHQLTHGPGMWQTCPHWSPDGRQIVFESVHDDRASSVDDRSRWWCTAPLTTDARDQRCPTWSRDGRWIYFTSDDGSGRGVWRMPATGGASTRLTIEGTGEAVWESVDGSRLFYTIGDALWSVPAAGGAPRQVLTCVKGAAIAVGASGIYYASCNFMFELNTALHVMDPDTQHDRTDRHTDGLLVQSGGLTRRKDDPVQQGCQPWTPQETQCRFRPDADRELQVAALAVRVWQHYRRTRWRGGRVRVWLAAGKQTSRGEGSSGLAFDRLVDPRRDAFARRADAQDEQSAVRGQPDGLVTFGSVAALLASVALAACYVPARRASSACCDDEQPAGNRCRCSSDACTQRSAAR